MRPISSIESMLSFISPVYQFQFRLRPSKDKVSSRAGRCSKACHGIWARRPAGTHHAGVMKREARQARMGDCKVQCGVFQLLHLNLDTTRAADSTYRHTVHDPKANHSTPAAAPSLGVPRSSRSCASTILTVGTISHDGPMALGASLLLSLHDHGSAVVSLSTRLPWPVEDRCEEACRNARASSRRYLNIWPHYDCTACDLNDLADL
ncbi:hypothetical protein KC341_g8 [Hortaea werneckii]|nr:hypothetical protein KC341_g8 [Hortaea werneckii]